MQPLPSEPKLKRDAETTATGGPQRGAVVSSRSARPSALSGGSCEISAALITLELPRSFYKVLGSPTAVTASRAPISQRENKFGPAETCEVVTSGGGRRAPAGGTTRNRGLEPSCCAYAWGGDTSSRFSAFLVGEDGRRDRIDRTVTVGRGACAMWQLELDARQSAARVQPNRTGHESRC